MPVQIRVFPALSSMMVLAGCAAALPAAPGPIQSSVPPALPSAAISAPATASPVPSTTPAPWLEATFMDATGLNPGTDMAAFDTRKPREGGQPSGGTFSAWREQTNYGAPHGRAFVVEGSWSYGHTPWNGRRALQLWFLAVPTAGRRFTLAAGAPTATTARLTYHQESRFRQDVWAAIAGTLAVEAAEGGAVRVVATGASPTPIPSGGTAAYRRYQIADPVRDGRDMTVTVDTVQPPMGDAGATRVEGTMAGGLVGDHYDFEVTLTYTTPAGAKTTGREALHLRYDAAAGELVGDREVGAPVKHPGGPATDPGGL